MATREYYMAESNTRLGRITTIVFLGALLSSVGCLSESVSFRGNLLRERRVNERVTYGPPFSGKTDWQSSPGRLSLQLQYLETKSFGIERTYEKKEYFERYTTGRLINVPQTYVRTTEETEIKDGPEKTAMASAVDVQVRLSSDFPAFFETQAVQTDASGKAQFTLARSIDKAMMLEPTDLHIHAKWKGEWRKIGTARLTEQTIAHVVARATADSMAEIGTPTLPPYAKVSVTTAREETKAGDECEIAVSVTNTGKGEFYQLVATSESSVVALNGLSFKFGKLGIGESLTLKQAVRIPQDQPTGPASVRFKWSEYNDFAPNPVTGRVLVRGLPRPRFAVAVQVLDDNTGNSVGNGDGRIQKGEAVDLLITVKNIGDGEAREAKVSISGVVGDGVILAVGEKALGRLAPSAASQVRLTITTKKSAQVDKLTPTVTVVDDYLGVRSEQTLTLALDSKVPPAILAYKQKVYVGKDEIVIRSGAGDETPLFGRAKPWAVLQATGELGGWVRVALSEGRTGWISRQLISFTPPKKTAGAPTGGVITVLQKAAPLIAVARPLDGLQSDRADVQVSGVIADDKAVTKTEFRLNGRKISPKGVVVGTISPVKTRRELPFSFPVTLAEGANKIEILAWDDDGLKSQKTVSVVYEKSKGTIHLVCIGIDAYRSVPKLKYAAGDAKAMAACLGKRLGVVNKNVHLLLDKDATLKNIRDVLGVKLRRAADKGDTVVIYFSGHGAPEADAQSADADGVAKYLLPVGADKSSLFSTALPMDEIGRIFRRLQSERVVFLADTCYSGAAGGRTIALTGKFRSMQQDKLLTRLTQTGKGRVIMTASQGSEVAQESEKLRHGVFTYYVLKGLDGQADKNRDGRVSVTELYEYVSKEVPGATKNSQHPLMRMDKMVGELVLSVVKQEGK